MAAIPKQEPLSDPIQQVKTTVRIEDYATGKMGLVPTRKTRNEWWFLCPFHKESTASFHIRLEQQDFRCFGCGAGLGDVIDLEMRATGETNPRIAAEHILAEYGVRPASNVQKMHIAPEPVKIRPLRTPVTETEPQSDDPGLAWLAERGISAEVARRNRIGTGRNKHGRMAVQFVYVYQGEIVNRQTRGLKLPTGGKKPFDFEDGADVIPFGYDDCAGGAEFVLVEGVMDKLAIEEATRRTDVLAMPSATPGEKAYGLLADLAKGATKIVLAVDADAAGETFKGELIRRLGADLCWVVTWPDGCKDANDVLMQHGAGRLQQCLDQAMPMPVDGVFTIDDSWDQIERLYAEGLPAGISTGWPLFDRYYTGRKRQLTVITGTPGSGKSVWSDALLMNWATGSAAWKFAICSPEMQPLERHWVHLIQLWAGKPFGKGPRERLDRESLRQAKEFLADRFFMVLPEEPTVDAVLDRMLWTHRRHGVDGWLLDPWNEMDHSRPNGMTMTEYCNNELRKIKRVLQNHDVWGGLIAHPTKLYRQKADGKYPVPTLYDIADSAAFFNKADNGIVLVRDKEDFDQPVQVHVQKVRFAEIGGLGMQPFGYDRATGRYADMPVDLPENGGW